MEWKRFGFDGLEGKPAPGDLPVEGHRHLRRAIEHDQHGTTSHRVVDG
jgi:hypothetical protein